jgi:hypothetical protein
MRAVLLAGTICLAMPVDTIAQQAAQAAMDSCVDLAEAADHALPETDHPDFHLSSARQRAIFDLYSECARAWFRKRREERGGLPTGS